MSPFRNIKDTPLLFLPFRKGRNAAGRKNVELTGGNL